MAETGLARCKAVLSWFGVAFAIGLATWTAISIAALDFYLSFNPWLVMGLAVVVTLGGTWLWRGRDARKPTLSANCLTAAGQLLALALACIVFFWAFQHIYPPNVPCQMCQGG